MAESRTPAPQPTEINLHAKSRVLEIVFDDGKVFRLPFEFLRVFSPSAEVQGHGPGQETLQVGKRDVTITHLDPVGYYAVQPTFSDGHSTGIFSWQYLYEAGLITYEDALRNADSLNDLRLEIKLHGKEAKNRNVFAGIGNMDIVPEQQPNNVI